MKRSANHISKQTVLGLATAVMCLAILPGCAVIGPALSIGGMAGLAPLQYASTAFTIGEFSYQYAVNDKDPSEVIEAKIDDVLTGKAFMLPEFVPGAKQLNNGFAEKTAQSEDDAPVNPTLAAKARQERIENILGRRNLELRRIEQRRLAFFSHQNADALSLQKTAAATPSLGAHAYKGTTLR